MTYTPEQRRRRNEASIRWRKRNPDKDKATRRRHYQKNKRKQRERDKDRYFPRHYGITREDRDAILTRQGNVCAVCGSADPKGKLGWHLDHCHQTKKVRGVLCRKCNTGLGKFNDSPQLLAAALKYLEQHQ